MSNEKYTIERITDLHRWTPTLFSFRTTRDQGFRFIPGQYARLGLPDSNGKLVWRPYSMVSAAYDDHLEFFSIIIPDGEFTSLLKKSAVGDQILVDKTSYGFLTTDRFRNGGDLWLLATGTGLAPFISILHDPAVWDSYHRIILVHSVRTADELAYRSTLTTLQQHPLIGERAAHLIYIPVITRERTENSLSQRIPALIESGELEARAGVRFNHDDSRIMICGNPDMVSDTRNQFKTMNYTLSKRREAGQLVIENAF